MTCVLFKHLGAAFRAFAAAAGISAAVICCAAYAEESAPGKLADARPGDVRLFASGSLRATMQNMRGQLERATGRRIVVESSESRILQQEIDAGQSFEAALLTTSVINDLAASGKIVAGSVTKIGSVRVGVAIRGDAPKLDVATVAGLKRAIAGAHSIRRYYGVGVSVAVLDNLFSKLGLVETTQDKMVRLGGDLVVPEMPLARGQYELIINLISAVKPMKGWAYLGPIPEEFQMPASHSVGLGASGDLDLGRKVLRVITGPEFKATLLADGFTAD